MIQQLFEQLGDLDLRLRGLRSDYDLQRGQLSSARDLFLRQLADAFRQRQETTAADFAARGLSQSGLYNEALAQLGREQTQEASAYEADYRNELANLLSAFTQSRAELERRRAQIRDHYQRARADRARILSLMG